MVWNATLKGIARRNRHIMMNVQQKVAVIGAGNWGKTLVRNFHDLGSLEIICESNTERLKSLALQYPSVRNTTNYSEVLKNRTIIAIAISTPAESHVNS